MAPSASPSAGWSCGAGRCREQCRSAKAVCERRRQSEWPHTTPMHSAQLGIGSGWRVARKPGNQARDASPWPTDLRIVSSCTSTQVLGVQYPTKFVVPYRMPMVKRNHLAACGAPGEWADVDFDALLQGRRCHRSFHRSFSAKLCKVRRPSNPTKLRAGCFSYA
jgi:hypothetical protein